MSRTKFATLYLVHLHEEQHEHVAAHSVQDVLDFVKRAWPALEVVGVKRVTPIVYGTAAAVEWMVKNGGDK